VVVASVRLTSRTSPTVTVARVLWTLPSPKTNPSEPKCWRSSMPIDNQKTSLTYEPESGRIIIIHPDLGGVHVIRKDKLSPIRGCDQHRYGSEVASRMAGVEPPHAEDLEKLRCRMRLAGTVQRERLLRERQLRATKTHWRTPGSIFGGETGRYSAPSNIGGVTEFCAVCRGEGYNWHTKLICPKCKGSGHSSQDEMRCV
jgi:hypothetical protein